MVKLAKESRKAAFRTELKEAARGPWKQERAII